MNRELNIETARIGKLEKAIGEYRRFFQSGNVAEQTLMLMNHQFRSFYFVDAPPWRILLRKANLDQRVLPDFWLTGAVRSGTSALSNYIFQHPCLALPLSKELSMTMYQLDYLKAQFPKTSELDQIREQFGAAITGHATPSSPAANMVYFNKKLNPSMKLVVILRDPVERTISHWRWDLMKTENLRKDSLWEFMPQFTEAMQIEMSEVGKGGCGFSLASGSGGTSYLRHSIYGPTLELLMNEFGSENIHLVEAREFFTKTNDVVNEVYEFLGLPACSPVEISEKNHSPPIEVTDEIKQELTEFFEPYNQELYELVGRSFDW